jgi:glucose/arabinose dehydrogenase
MSPAFRTACALLLTASLAGCFRLLPTKGGGMTDFDAPRRVDAGDVVLPPGYRIEPVATGLTFPTGVAFGADGRAYVTEAGYSYGGFSATPRLLRVEADGSTTEIAAGDNPPWNGVVYHDGAFFVAGGHERPGQVLRITPDGETTVLVDGLPSLGDHHTNGPAVGPDGWLYFGQGTATNAAVVGLDNYDFGWLREHPDFHDTPCRDVTLTGLDRTTPNPLTPDEGDRVTTGAFVPFGTPTAAGQVIPGALPCSGAVMRVRPDGSDLELVAWGFRNPFGLAFDGDGALYVTENQYDVRGSRPVFGTGDLLWRVEPEAGTAPWYGWPDYWAGIPLTEDGFEAPGERMPGTVLQEPPGEPQRPVVVLGVHASANGLDLSRSAAFGYEGDAFVAEFGDMAPGTGKVLAPIGYRVVRVDVEAGTVHEFAANRGGTNGPGSWLGSGGLEQGAGPIRAILYGSAILDRYRTRAATRSRRMSYSP